MFELTATEIILALVFLGIVGLAVWKQLETWMRNR